MSGRAFSGQEWRSLARDCADRHAKAEGFAEGLPLERWNRVRSFCKKAVWRPMRWKFRWQGSPLFLARVPLARVETRERLSCNACYGKRLRAKRCRGTHWHDGDPCQARKLARVGDGLHARVDGLPRLIGPIGTALPFVKWSSILHAANFEALKNKDPWVARPSEYLRACHPRISHW
jgi:hypothetical protein